MSLLFQNVLRGKMDKNTREVMFSSKSDEWGTPRDLFENLNKKFNFTLDPCATSENKKCLKYYTKEQDGLSKDWSGETVFINPPYTGGAIGKWVKKAYEETEKNAETTVVCLIPSRTDTRYWHDYCMKASNIYFIKGRLRFDGESDNSAPFPSAIIVFSKKLKLSTRPMIGQVGKKGEPL